ncbi:MAG TPA: MOSC N-terminal beta barrel domain-containing protein [Blastococcus sp.]|nr:MOSC N-terminal beta barrel domain-containing protein [Blastococcus sp.]
MEQQGTAVVGRVREIWVYPVRSLAGSSAATVEVTPQGLAGDRAWTVVDGNGPVRAKDAPAMSDVVATGDPEVDALAVSAALGRPVTLAATVQKEGVAPVHLVSRGAIERAAAGEVPEGCSADDPRANLVLEVQGEDERAWVGRVLHVGGVVLEVTRTPKHCLGVYADVRHAGRISVGDDVLI